MQITEPARKLLYQHEVLRAKLELKNHLLESVVREIYEQTGQVLSLARFRLATAEGRIGERFQPEIAEAGNLVSEAISKLRKLSKNLFPEQEIIKGSVFIETLYEELQMDLSGNLETLQVSGTPATLEEEPGVILLAITLSIIALIRKLAVENSLSVKILYTETHIFISMSYHGNPIDLGASANLEETNLSATLNIQQRLELIHGSITSNPAHNGTAGYEIKVPL